MVVGAAWSHLRLAERTGLPSRASVGVVLAPSIGPPDPRVGRRHIGGRHSGVAEDFVGSSPRATLLSAFSVLTFTFNQLLLEIRWSLAPTSATSGTSQWSSSGTCCGPRSSCSSARHRRMLLAVALRGWVDRRRQSVRRSRNRLVVAGVAPALHQKRRTLSGAAAALAVGLVRRPVRAGRWSGVALGAMGLMVIVVGGDETADLGWRGLVFTLATAALVFGHAGRRTYHPPGSPRGLEWRPLRALGAVSASVFVWHVPVFHASPARGATGAPSLDWWLATTTLVVLVMTTQRLIRRPIERRLAASRATALLPPTDRVRFRRATTGGAALGAVPFLLILWDWGVRPFAPPSRHDSSRTSTTSRLRALLNGQLDVPAGALSIEAFRIDGHEFMYFPPWPALLRIPPLRRVDVGTAGSRHCRWHWHGRCWPWRPLAWCGRCGSECASIDPGAGATYGWRPGSWRW